MEQSANKLDNLSYLINFRAWIEPMKAHAYIHVYAILVNLISQFNLNAPQPE